MTDVRTTLERLRDSVERPPDGFGRLVDYRSRSRVRQRVTAVVLALAIGAAGTVLAIHALGGGGPSTGSVQSPTPSSTPASHIAFDPVEVETFRVGPQGQTNSITAAAGSLWVTAYGVQGGGGDDRAALLWIDPKTSSVAQTIPLEGSPSWETGGGGVVATDDSLWVTGVARLAGEGAQAIVSRVDLATGSVVATIPLGGNLGADVAINSDGVWVAIFGKENAELVQVDPSTNAVIGRTALPSNYVRRIVAVDGAVLLEEFEWRGGGPCGFFTAVDPTTGTIIAREPVSAECGLASLKVWDDGTWASFGGRFAPMDPHTAQPAEGGFSFEQHHEPRGFLVTDRSGIWYAAYPGNDGNGPDRLTRMDPTTGEITEYDMRLDHGALDAATLGGSLWTANFDGTVTRIDLTG
jgi:hypothetical protein